MNKKKAKYEQSFLSLSSLASINYTDNWRTVLEEKIGKKNFDVIERLMKLIDVKESNVLNGVYEIIDKRTKQICKQDFFYRTISKYWEKIEKKFGSSRFKFFAELLSRAMFVKKLKDGKIESLNHNRFASGRSKASKNPNEYLTRKISGLIKSAFDEV